MNAPDLHMSGRIGMGQEDSAVGPTGGNRGFWLIFAGGWLGYMGLLSAAAILEGEPLYPNLLLTLFPAAMSTIVAWHRRRLVNPEHSFVRTGCIFLLTGILFAVLSALCSYALITAIDLQAVVLRGTEPRFLFAKLVLYSVSLYVLLVAYVMWSVSVERIQESRALAAREAVLRAKAEAKALRAQFNPHFVFNTLHSLMLLVREDPGTAERAIEDVASLIRYASRLDRRGQDVVPLSQEIDIARKFLALESLRLEDRLEVAWEIATDLGDVAVPAFALQTLLENAIKHGLSPKPEGGTITIRVWAEAERMFMTVSDDGMGAARHDVAASDGSGLMLLEQRMSSLYGDAGECSWSTEPGRGFEVTLEWPKTQAGEPTKASAG